MTRGAVAALLAEGVAHHQAGRLAEAEQRYRQVLGAAPNHAEALNLLGMLALQAGHAAPALELADAAIRVRPGHADFHGNRGHALKALGRLDTALASYQQACRLDPRAAGAYYNLGNALQLVGRAGDAEAAYQRAVALQPDFADAHNNLGNALRERGRFAEAAASFQAAVTLQPARGMLHFNLAAALEHAGEAERAIGSYREGARLAPDIAADAHGAAARLLRSAGRPAEAVAALEAALALRPSDVALHTAMAFALTDCDRMADAEAHLRTAHALDPADPAPLTNLGNHLRNTWRLEAATQCFDAALQSRPGYAAARYGRSTVHLLEGRWQAGWDDYEARFAALHGHTRFDAPAWAGEDLGGRTLLLHHEQGFGDTIQFCRYVPLAAARGRVVLEVQRPLLPLLAHLPGPTAVVAAGDALPHFDAHCPLMGLPRAFGATPEHIPAEIPYLAADPDLAAFWRARVAPLGGRRVGLAWQGRRSYAEDRLRSIPAAMLDALRGVPGVTFVSLQIDARAPVVDYDWTDELTGFASTAALISALDLVVAVDTAVAHLAGALGRPVWLLNRDQTDWRWGRDRADSPWYPSMRIFRQPRRGDWGSVLAAVRAELALFSAGSAP